MSHSDKRFRNVNWEIPRETSGNISFDGAQLSVLMDIRDELQRINLILSCKNVTDIPIYLSQIAKNTKKVRRRKEAI
jgi:hypothetical protein